ncbi:GMC family oxidoreductase [Pseudaestuariivita atlantica]|uniref:Choline dehydrogenase n=1 Tax=Pseudaestuariivita atlantica TaxID=1317121 RepID=A0A0L1JRG0_9RHOB|nr:GMC family oxidoreductase [Pseudaestuariivita atlantica]KNG94326.1 choline dehydrogenase [Pseudaestuariivita atlantica]
MTADTDILIVGAGTAGCVLANRLSADGRTRVTLLEAGKDDRTFWVPIPVGYLFTMGNPRTDWMMRTAEEPGLGGRSLPYPRGKVLGGCSSINGMLYLRGQAADYDGWRQMGNAGWGWDDVLPYFLRSEDHHAGGEGHGQGGDWKVTTQRLHWDILDAVAEAAAEMGVPPTPDFNTGDNEGSGYFEVNQHRGTRWSAARGFLRPAKGRANLRIRTECEVRRLTWDGTRVTGAVVRDRGAERTITAREVILCAGSINSPKALELSGVGSPERLKALGIDPVIDLPGVGENLQDHLQIRTVFEVSNAVTLNQLANSWTGKARMALEYMVRRSGPLAMAPSQFGLFTRSDASRATPNVEYHVQPLSCDRLGGPLHDFPGITVSVCNLRPESRGTCHITTTDLDSQPDIRLNYLSTPGDRQVAVDSIRQARALMATRAMAPYAPRERLPGPETDDADLAAKAGEIATTIFHPVGTCKMGHDPMAVVDDRLRVHKARGLRVVDASIMPTITSGNTASPVVMIAEKAADMIAEDLKG